MKTLSELSEHKPLDWAMPIVVLGKTQTALIFFRNSSGTLSQYSLEEAVDRGYVRVKKSTGSWQDAAAFIEIRIARVCIVLKDAAEAAEEPAMTAKQYNEWKRKHEADLNANDGYGLQTKQP